MDVLQCSVAAFVSVIMWEFVIRKFLQRAERGKDAATLEIKEALAAEKQRAFGLETLIRSKDWQIAAYDDRIKFLEFYLRVIRDVTTEKEVNEVCNRVLGERR